MPEKKILSREGFVLEYVVMGSGSKCLIALHGHAKSAEDYSFLEKELPEYTIIAINLFFHGNSILPPERDYSKPIQLNEWLGLFELLFEKEKISQFSILAYSLGGRWGFNLLQYFPHKVKHMIFMAPDGLNKNGWYHRTAGSRFLRALFKKVVERPKTFLFILKWARRFRFITKRLHQFLLYHLETKEKRKKAYRTWMMYRDLFPDHQKVTELLKKHPHEKHLVLGKYDAIISLKHSRSFIKRNSNYINVHQIDSGHDFFKENQLKVLVQMIKDILSS